MVTIESIKGLIDHQLKVKGLVASQVSMQAVGNPDAIRTIKNGRMPSLDRWAKLCRVLDIDFYTGLGAPSEGKPEPSSLKIDDLRSQLADLQVDLIGRLSETAAAVEALTITPANDDEQGEAHPVQVVEVASAAGAGSVADMETVTGYVWFRQSWLRDHAIDPKHCAVIGVKGDSMEPTLMDGCSILVDYNRTRRLTGHIYVIRTYDGLVAKRLAHDDTGGWILRSDNEEELDRAWSDDMEVIGEVRWTARTLTGA